jgi:two-component system sensor histidine kinase/response regulator
MEPIEKKNVHSVSEEALNRFRGISYENAIVSITDQAGTILVANKKFCEISGYSEEELLGQNHRIVNSGTHTKGFFEGMWNTLLEGESWVGEVCNRAKDGSHYWVDTTIHPVFDESTNQYQFISIRLDVTHRKKYEEVLKNVQHVGKIGYWDLLIENNQLYWSSEVYRIFGLDPFHFSPTIEKSVELFAPEHYQALEEALQKAIETGTGYDLELQIIDSKGKRVWTRAVSQVELRNGKPFRVYGTFQDIDKRKRMRIELNKSQTKLNLALEAAGIGNWAYFPQMDELVWDEASFEIFGVDKNEITGTIQDWVGTLHPDDKEATLNRFENTVKNQERLYNSEFRILHPSKGERMVKGRAIIEYDKNGAPCEIMGLNWDITDDIQFQKSLIEAKEKALEATRAKSTFLASMSHEIRTPMNGMMGMLELLRESALNSEQQELVSTIESCGDQLITIVNDILDFSKIEAGKMTMEYRPFDLEKVLKGVRGIFEAQLSKKGIKFILDVDESLPPVIKGDETRLKQVLTNLISNSAKFTKEGSITLSVKMDKKRSFETQGIFLFQIKDTGIGIPIEKQKYLFQSFRQVDDSTSREYGGTGLGLAICKSLVEKFGGHIGVESEPGVGSIFFFEVMAGIGQVEEKGEEKTVVSDFQKDLKILLAEDNKTNQLLALKFLNKLGCTGNIIVANNGLEAIEKVNEHIDKKPFDVVLMDVQMPKMDGLQATRKIVSEYKEKAPVIIAMTANAFEDDRKACLDAGMKEFIPKPIKKALLKSTLAKFFPAFSEDKCNDSIINMNEELPQTKADPMSSEFKLIDPKKILFEFEEDFDIFEELVQEYKEQSPELFSGLKSAVESQDAGQLKISAHTIKGIVSNFYSEELRETAFKLETSGSEGDFSNTQENLLKFEKLNENVLFELEKFVESFTAGTYQAA